MTENTQQNAVRYAHSDLEVVVNTAKRMGFKVWTYKRMNENEPVSYVYIDNGVTFGGCQNGLGGLKFGTCHKGAAKSAAPGSVSLSSRAWKTAFASACNMLPTGQCAWQLVTRSKRRRSPPTPSAILGRRSSSFRNTATGYSAKPNTRWPGTIF